MVFYRDKHTLFLEDIQGSRHLEVEVEGDSGIVRD